MFSNANQLSRLKKDTPPFYPTEKETADHDAVGLTSSGTSKV